MAGIESYKKTFLSTIKYEDKKIMLIETSKIHNFAAHCYYFLKRKEYKQHKNNKQTNKQTVFIKQLRCPGLNCANFQCFLIQAYK